MNKRQRKKARLKKLNKTLSVKLPKEVEDRVITSPKITTLFNPITGDATRYLTYDQTLPADFRTTITDSSINIQRSIYNRVHDYIRRYGLRPSRLIISRNDLWDLKGILVNQCSQYNYTGVLDEYEGMRVIEAIEGTVLEVL
jgi:hypothetical protein